MLTNNHVIAGENATAKGSPIIQPGALYDDIDFDERRIGALGNLAGQGDTGGSNGKGLTYASPIATVLAELDVQLLF